MNSRTATQLLLDAMEEKAGSLGLRGVGVAYVVDPNDRDNRLQPGIVIVEAFHREPDLAKGPEDVGASYLCVAWAKFAQMLRVWDDSGYAEPVKGEFPYKGGIIREVLDRKVLVAFSGGTQQQDVEVAEHAIDTLTEFMPSYGWRDGPDGLLIILGTTTL